MLRTKIKPFSYNIQLLRTTLKKKIEVSGLDHLNHIWWCHIKVSFSFNASNFSQNKKNEASKTRSVVSSDLIQHQYFHWSKKITANPPNKY